MSSRRYSNSFILSFISSNSSILDFARPAFSYIKVITVWRDSGLCPRTSWLLFSSIYSIISCKWFIAVSFFDSLYYSLMWVATLFASLSITFIYSLCLNVISSRLSDELWACCNTRSLWSKNINESLRFYADSVLICNSPFYSALSRTSRNSL